MRCFCFVCFVFQWFNKRDLTLKYSREFGDWEAWWQHTVPLPRVPWNRRFRSTTDCHSGAEV